VLEFLARDNVACAAITVEFDQPTPIAGIVRSVARLYRRGYRVVAVDGWNVTLLSTGG
jgi:hypothetical protein